MDGGNTLFEAGVGDDKFRGCLLILLVFYSLC